MTSWDCPRPLFRLFTTAQNSQATATQIIFLDYYGKEIECNVKYLPKYNHGHNILRLFDVWPNFPFTKHGIYELLNNLRLWILVIRKYQENLKASKNYSLKLSLPPKMNFFSILAKKPWKIEIELSLSAQFHRKTRLCLKYFVHECLWKQFFANNFPWTPLNLICLTVLATLRHLTQF